MHVAAGIAALAGLAAIAFEPGPPRITWVAPEVACPGAPEVEERLVRLLGAEAAAVRAEARVAARAAGWQVELALEWRGNRDTRTLEAERCETLADATVLLVATMADPLAVLRHTPTEPPPPRIERSASPPPDARVAEPPLPRVVPTLPPVSASLASPDPARSQRPRDRGLALGVSGQLDLGTLPRIAGGVGAGLGYRWPRARLFVEATYLPSRPVVSRAPHARQGRVQLGVVRMGACVRAWVRAVELPLCGGAEVGGTRSTGFGVGAELGASDPWVALFGDGGVVIPLMASLAVFGRVGVAVPLVYSEYVFGEERLYRAQPAALRGGIGFEFRWVQRKARLAENRGNE